MHLILWLVLNSTVANAQINCDLSSYGVPISVTGTTVTFDNEKFSLEERPAPEAGITLTPLPKDAEWKHLALIYNDRSIRGLNISVQFVKGVVANVDVFTSAGEPVKRLKLSNTETKCLVSNYTYTDQTNHVIYSRDACDKIHDATKPSKNPRETSNDISQAVGKIVSRENLSYWGANNQPKPVNSSSMGDVLKYMEGCGRYSGRMEPRTFPRDGRPAPAPAKKLGEDTST